ncbi:ABC transporter ATP-binding protein [Avibacterium paragallinarum]|uniref:ABC transporter ATP-binding protein n=1 Tax=Avibacterium paragallinarum TaxID=728 RepID=UPI0021F70101|nr:ABC transporter ATP-binding protein [Avibacterium paragallinarum]UXN37826.1 ABC transporter ATP-binding protein [Avibacterium paragallinarum]
MMIYLDCGAELQILRLETGYQLLETLPNGKVRKVGRLHKSIQGVLDEITFFALTEHELLAIEESKAVIKNTCDKVLEYFQLNSEYLAHLAQPSI